MGVYAVAIHNNVLYLVRPGAPEVTVRQLPRPIRQVDRLVKLRNGLVVHALALQQLRQAEVQHVGIVPFVHPVRGGALLQAGVRDVVLFRVYLRLCQEEQLSAQRHIVGDELTRIFR